MAQLTPSQARAEQAFQQFLLDPAQRELRISGSPGVGKSFLTQYLVQTAIKNAPLLKIISKSEKEIELKATATTHKAARVLTKNVGQQAHTIHSTLKLTLHIDYRTGKTTLQKTSDYHVHENVVIFIDEASYIDQQLLDMIRASTINCKVVYIGDKDQLAPVMSTNIPVFDDPNIPEVELVERVRFNGSKDIEHLVDQLQQVVRSRTFSPISLIGPDTVHVDQATFTDMVNAEFTRPDFQHDDAKVLAWSNDRVQGINEYIRHIRSGNIDISVGEMVICNNFYRTATSQIRIDTEVYVEDIFEPTTYLNVPGRFVRVNDGTKKMKVFYPDDYRVLRAMLRNTAREKDWKSHYALKECIADLRAPYASTVHKSQGSTYKKVFIDLADIGKCNIPDDVARMLYVAASRASEQVVLCGQLPRKYCGV